MAVRNSIVKKIVKWWENLPVSVNKTNSSLGILCTASAPCEYRHTELCGECSCNEKSGRMGRKESCFVCDERR